MRAPVLVRISMALVACAALSGCTASEDAAPVTVVLASGSQLADAPSAFLVRIASAAGGDEVRATATTAVTVEDEGLVLLDEELPPGQYRLEAAQQGCGTSGEDCPDDPSSSKFVGAREWHCSVAFEASTDTRTRIEIVEGPDPDRTDQRVCRVVT